MPVPFWVFFLFFSISPLLFAAALTGVTIGIATKAATQTDSVKSRIADLITRFS
jgi:hypothetical protein